MKEYKVLIERGSDGIYVGSVPSLPGCHTDGETVEELLKNLKEAILLWEEVDREEKQELEFIQMKSLEV